MKKISLIGAGFIGTVHAQNLSRHPDIIFTHVFDTEEKRAAQLAKKFKVRAVDLNTILNSDDDAVLIASSTNTHADIIERAVRHRKAIFCEKPIDLNLKRVRETAQLVKDSGLPNMVDFNRRFDASHSALKQAVARKEIGKVEIVQFTARDQAPPPIEYVKVSGGQLRDQAIHFFDLLCFLTDDYPVSVFAMGAALINKEIGEAGDVDTSIITLRMSSGSLAHIDCSRRCPYGYDERVEVLGSEGMLESARQAYRHLAVYKKQHKKTDGMHSSWYERIRGTYYEAIDGFVRLLHKKKGTDQLPDFQDGLRAQIIADTASKALKSGKPEKIVYD